MYPQSLGAQLSLRGFWVLLATSPSFSGWETGLAFNPPEGPHSGQQGVLPVFQVSSLRAKVSFAGVGGRIEGTDASPCWCVFISSRGLPVLTLARW